MASPDTASVTFSPSVVGSASQTVANNSIDLAAEFNPPEKIDLAAEFAAPDPDKEKQKREQLAGMVSDYLGMAFPAIPSVAWKAILTKGGTTGDVAASVIPPLAGSIVGSVGGPAGTAVGGGIGGAAGATLTEARQYFRGDRDELTAGPIVTGTLLGAIPLPGKVAPTALFRGGKLVAAIPQAIAVRGAQGAVLGAGAEGIGELIDTGKVDIPTLAKSAAWGALFGAGAGAFEAGALTLAQKDVINRIRKVTGVEARYMSDKQLIQKMKDIRAGKADNLGRSAAAGAGPEVVQPKVPQLADEFSPPATEPKAGTQQVEIPSKPIDLAPSEPITPISPETPVISPEPAQIVPNAKEPMIAAPSRIPVTEWGQSPNPEVKQAAENVVETIRPMDADQFMAWSKLQNEAGGITAKAMEIGRAAQDSPEMIQQFQELRDQYYADVDKAIQNGDFDSASIMGAKGQLFSEAYQYATNTGIAKLPMEGEKSYQAGTSDAPEIQAAVKPDVPPEDTTALNKDEIGSIRKTFDLESLPAPERQSVESRLNEAKAQGEPANSEVLADAILKNPRQLTPIEHAGMVIRAAELQNQYEKLVNDAALQMDVGNIHRGEELRQASEAVLDRLDTITEAADRAGTEAGRALNIRKMRVNRQTYELASVVQRARLAKKGSLTPQELDGFRKLSEQLKEQQSKVDALEKQLAEAQTKTQRQAADTFVHEGRALRSRSSKLQAAARRDALKKQIRDLGLRVNDITGAVGQGAQVARLVAQIAKTYIDEGASTLSEVSGKLKADLPDLTDQDIFNALGGRIKAEHKRIITEAQRRIGELQKQARLWAKISDALDKNFDTRVVPKDSPHVADLREVLAQLRLQANRVVQSDAKIKGITERINAIQDQLEGGFRMIPEAKTITPENVDVAALRRQMRELQSLMRTTDAISDLEEQLRTGEFDVSPPEKRIIQNSKLQQALVKRKQLQREVNARIDALRKKNAFEKAVDIATLPRTLMATADMSATLRQAAFLSAGMPVTAAKAFVQAFQAFFSQNTADAIDLAIKMHPNQAERIKAGLFLSELDTAPSRHEEQFVSNLAARIPFIGAIVRASERNMMTTLNLIRTAAFDGFIKAHPDATLDQKKAFAAYVNVASGRGDLGNFNSATKELNAILFAPRYAASRFQLLYSPLKNIKDPLVRKEIAKDWLAFIGTGMTVLGLAALAGAKVGIDPESSDFGKIIIGDTRYDIWGGLQQPARLLLTAMFKGLEALGLHKPKKKVDLLDAGMRFASYKLAPSVTVPLTLLQGRNIIGQPQPPSETILRSVTPLVAQDVFEAYQNERQLDEAALAGTASFFGMGVNTYKAKPPSRSR